MNTENEKRFKSRQQAGELLVKHLVAYKHRDDVVVLALPRRRASRICRGKKAGSTARHHAGTQARRAGREELAMGAIASGGLCVVKAEIVEIFDIPTDVIEAIAKRELHETGRREKLYRAGRPALPLHGKIAILVDDGVATGATMLAAVRAVRRENPAKVIVAIPVAARASYDELVQEADEVICLRTPEPFYAVGLWYEEFTQTTDAEVVQLLTEAQFSVGDHAGKSRKGNAGDHGPRHA